MSRFELATPAPEVLLYEAVDVPMLSNQTAGFLRRGGKLLPQGLVTQPLLGANLGAVTFASLAGNLVWQVATSGGGGEGSQSTSTPLTAWPVGVDSSVIASSLRFPTRYEYSVLLVRTPAPLALDVPFGVNLYWASGTQNLLSLAANTWVGYEVSSRLATNGGNWSVYTRQVSGGALSAAVDTGVHPDAGVAHVTFRFDFTASNPTFVILLNGVAVLTQVGLANLVQPTTYASGLFRIAVTQNSALVGQSDGWTHSHLTITRLPGFTV